MTQQEKIKKDNPELHVDLMFPSKYLKAADFRGKEVNLTIKSVAGHDLQTTRGKEFKYVVCFNETDKMLVLNKTNAKAIAEALKEPKAVNWTGKKITLFPTTCEAFGKITDCIRVKQ